MTDLQRVLEDLVREKDALSAELARRVEQKRQDDEILCWAQSLVHFKRSSRVDLGMTEYAYERELEKRWGFLVEAVDKDAAR